MIHYCIPPPLTHLPTQKSKQTNPLPHRSLPRFRSPSGQVCTRGTRRRARQSCPCKGNRPQRDQTLCPSPSSSASAQRGGGEGGGKREVREVCVGGCTHFIHTRSLKSIDPLASLQCRDGTRRVFTEQVDIARTKREAP